MRRIIVLLGLAALLTLALAACQPAPTPAPTPAPPANATPAVAPDPNAPVKVESARAIVDVVDDKNAVFAALSPDGKYLAYFLAGDRKTPGKICLYAFDTASKKCNDLPLDQFLGYPYQLQWSADSKKITFTENPIDMGYDADIWVLDVASGAVTDLTNDNVVGSWVAPTGTPSSVVDYLPMWGPKDGQIYFWRFQNQGEYMKFTLTLNRIDPAGGEPVEVANIAQALPRSAPRFTQEQFYMGGPSVVSPDGKHVAALLSTPNDMGMLETSLYRIPLDGAAPVKLMDAAAYNAAVPSWTGYQAFPAGLSWTSDGKGVVTMGSTGYYSSYPFTVFYYVDVATGKATPLVDFSTLTNSSAYAEPMPGSNNTIPARWYSPWTGGLSPKADKLLMINDLAGTIGLMSSNLPPTGALPAISATADASTMSTASRTSTSADGKMTLYGLLLKVTE